MHAATVEAGNWWARSRGADKDAWIAQYQRSLTHRHRNAIVEIVKGLGAETLIEVGCHCGPNLVRLAQEMPELRMIGVDINQEAIDAGRLWVKSMGLERRIQLNCGRIPQMTADTPTGSCEVVLSCYALAYIAPPDLDAVLYEMGRLATKAVVLAEPMGEQAGASRAFSGYSEWVHDYQGASRWMRTWQGMTKTVVPIEPPIDRLNGILVARR